MGRWEVEGGKGEVGGGRRWEVGGGGGGRWEVGGVGGQVGNGAKVRGGRWGKVEGGDGRWEVKGRRWEGGGGRWEEVGGGRWEEEEVGGGRWVAPNRTAPTDTSSKETAGNANRTEPNRNTHDTIPFVSLHQP